MPPISQHQLKKLAIAPINWLHIWPHLRLISCWTDGSASLFVAEIERLFPGILIQGKGLLATEAPMTFPLLGVNGGVPLLNEVLFEFENKHGELLLLHELRLGEEYTLIISQKSGLIRYRIGDSVRVVSFLQKTPCLKFIGRSNQVSDLVGEKLNEVFVRDTLSSILSNICTFWCLIPMINSPDDIFYICLVDKSLESSDALEETIEQALQTAFHYRNARLLGQLQPVRIRYFAQLSDHYYAFFNHQGIKWGDVKFAALLTQPAQAKRLFDYLDNELIDTY